MKSGRRGFLYSLFAAPFLAKAAAQIEPKVQPVPLPVQKVPAVPADYLTCASAAMPSGTFCFMWPTDGRFGMGDYLPSDFRIPQRIWPAVVIPKREGFE